MDGPVQSAVSYSDVIQWNSVDTIVFSGERVLGVICPGGFKVLARVQVLRLFCVVHIYLQPY